MTTPRELGKKKHYDSSAYKYIHKQVAKKRGRPSHCEKCGTNDPALRYEWSSKGSYKSIKDFVRLCKSCHATKDGAIKNLKKGVASVERKKYLRTWRLKNIERIREKARNKAKKWRINNPTKAHLFDKRRREKRAAKVRGEDKE